MIKTTESFSGRVALQQRVFPSYRKEFFETLGTSCLGGLCIFAGKPRPSESIPTTKQASGVEFTYAQNIHLLSGKFYVCLQPGFIRWLEQTRPDVLVIEANARYLFSQFAIQWMHARSRPVIAWGLGSPPIHGSLSRLRNRSRINFLHSLDAVISYSRRGAAEFIEAGIPPERVFVAHNAVTSKPTMLPQHSKKLALERLTVLFVGRLQSRKRVDNLIRVCSSIEPELQPELIVVGEGPELVRLEELAKQAYPRTMFKGGLYGSELTELYRKADLFVLPGTGGLAIQQAMANGLPVIAAQGDGTQEDLVQERNGWIVQPDNETELKTAIRSALSDPSRLTEMGKESFRIVTEEINIHRMTETFIEALNFVTSIRRADHLLLKKPARKGG